MDVLSSLLQAYSAIKKANEIYKTIQNAPKQMEKLASELANIRVYLGKLERLIRKESKRALGQLTPEELANLKSIINGITANADTGIDLMTKWNNDVVPGGMELSFRWKWITSGYYFVFGDAGRTIKDLLDDISHQQGQISNFLDIMTNEKVVALSSQVDQLTAQIEKMHASVLGLGLVVPPKRPSPSPSPPPPCHDFKILFVDPSNVGRGPACEYLMKLMKEWTVRTGGDWRIKNMDSSGFFVKRSASYIDLIEKLEYKWPSYKIACMDGYQTPDKVVVDAVFDNKAYDYPFKQGYRESFAKARSKGIRDGVFKNNDFILVFTNRELDNLQKLRKAIIARDGAAAAPKGKGKIVHMGTYIKKKDGAIPEIVDAPAGDDGKLSREKWNTKVAELKLACRKFLTKEMKWKQPDRGAKLE